MVIEITITDDNHHGNDDVNNVVTMMKMTIMIPLIMNE